MEPVLTLAWTNLASGERDLLEQRGRELGATVMQVDIMTLAASVMPMLARGALVIVVATDREASVALALGVDEVVRAGEVNVAALDQAIASANARATGRAARDAARGSYAHEWTAFAMLTAALGTELAPPLMVALTNCELLASSLEPVLDVGDEFISWATLVTPTEHLRRLVARRTAAPSSDELIMMVSDARAALTRAARLLRLLREITVQDGSDAVSAKRVLADVASILSNYLSARADLQVEASGPCVVKVPRPLLTCLVVCLLADALDAVRNSTRSLGHIRVSATEQEECVLIELWYDAPAPRTDLRPSLLNPYFAQMGQTSMSDMAGVRERVRQFGGDLLIDSDASTTSIRLFLPASADDAPHDEPPTRWTTVTKTRARSD